MVVCCGILVGMLLELEEASGMDPWIFDSSRLKVELVSRETVEVPEQDRWRVKYLHKLMVEKQEKHYMGEVEQVKQVSDLQTWK